MNCDLDNEKKIGVGLMKNTSRKQPSTFHLILL